MSEAKLSAQALVRAVESYFRQHDDQQQQQQQGDEEDGHNSNVRQTTLPPIYFQHPGHSMSIIGIEKQNDGRTNLLVFDPVFRDTDVILSLLGRKFRHKHPDSALRAYRRGPELLHKYRAFEILR